MELETQCEAELEQAEQRINTEERILVDNAHARQVRRTNMSDEHDNGHVPFV
jgi:exonuclease VII small subunit